MTQWWIQSSSIVLWKLLVLPNKIWLQIPNCWWLNVLDAIIVSTKAQLQAPSFSPFVWDPMLPRIGSDICGAALEFWRWMDLCPSVRWNGKSTLPETNTLSLKMSAIPKWNFIFQPLILRGYVAGRGIGQLFSCIPKSNPKGMWWTDTMDQPGEMLTFGFGMIWLSTIRTRAHTQFTAFQQQSQGNCLEKTNINSACCQLPAEVNHGSPSISGT